MATFTSGSSPNSIKFIHSPNEVGGRYNSTSLQGVTLESWTPKLARYSSSGTYEITAYLLDSDASTVLATSNNSCSTSTLNNATGDSDVGNCTDFTFNFTSTTTPSNYFYIVARSNSTGSSPASIAFKSDASLDGTDGTYYYHEYGGATEENTQKDITATLTYTSSGGGSGGGGSGGGSSEGSAPTGDGAPLMEYAVQFNTVVPR